MRVLTIVEDLGPGGTQRAAQNYTLGYKQAGYETAVLAMNAGGSREQELKNADIPVFIGGKLPEEQSRALQYANEWKPDIIHIHRRGFAEPKTAYVLKELKTSHNRVLETNVFSRVDYSSDRNLIDVHLQLSYWCLWKWKQWSCGINPLPIGTVLPYMIDTSAFYSVSSDIQNAFRNFYGIPQEAFVFGRIGQRSLPKWSPIIFAAFAEVAKKYPQAYLLLIGLPDELRPLLASISTTVRQRIIEIPFIQGDENLRTCYSAIDVFLHASSIGESFGMVLAESQLCGCPVITLSTPHKDNSQLEVVGHKRGGLIVTNQESMIEAMVQLVEDKTLRQYLSQEGSKWVKSKYDICEVMPTLLKISQIALASENRYQLKARLINEPEIVMNVDWLDIQELLINTIGTTSLKERVLMHIVHNYLFYRLYSRRLK